MTDLSGLPADDQLVPAVVVEAPCGVAAGRQWSVGRSQSRLVDARPQLDSDYQLGVAQLGQHVVGAVA